MCVCGEEEVICVAASNSPAYLWLLLASTAAVASIAVGAQEIMRQGDSALQLFNC